MKNDKPIFFLFTCVKDGKQYIQKLFNSLLVQSKKNFVHYIYEDGSESPLGEMVEEYKKAAASLDKPYQVIYEYNPTNIGLNKSTQHCINQCNLDFFIWIDCDNWVNETFFEELEKTVNKKPNSIVVRTNRVNHYNNGKELRCFEGLKNKRIMRRKKPLMDFLMFSFGYSFFAVNNEKFKKVNPNNTLVNERYFYNDNQIIFSCLYSQSCFSYSDKSISHFLYRCDSEGQLITDDFNKIEKMYEGILKLNTILQLEQPKKLILYKDICVLKQRMLNNYFNNRYGDAKECLKALKKEIKRLENNEKKYFTYLILKWTILLHISFFKQ